MKENKEWENKLVEVAKSMFRKGVPKEYKEVLATFIVKIVPILSQQDHDLEEKIKEIENLKWDFNCDCNMCYVNKKIVEKVLSILKK